MKAYKPDSADIRTAQIMWDRRGAARHAYDNVLKHLCDRGADALDHSVRVVLRDAAFHPFSFDLAFQMRLQDVADQLIAQARECEDWLRTHGFSVEPDANRAA